MGDLLPGRPWMYLPHTARLYWRKSQLPAGESFSPKTTLAVELVRQADAESVAPILAVMDGAYAVATVVESCLQPRPGHRRIEILTRLRADARLYHPVGPLSRLTGRRPIWGPRLVAPQYHVYWATSWRQGQAWMYGRRRKFRYKQLRCRWAVSGPHLPVHVFIAEMAGYQRPWFLVISALDLSAAQVVEAFAARVRQEDGFRDHKQRLGMEECRAWTKEPILRTFQVQLVALTLLRLLQGHLDQAWDARTCWLKPEWNPQKQHASTLDLRRLFWRWRVAFSHFLVALENRENIPQASVLRGTPPRRAA